MTTKMDFPPGTKLPTQHEALMLFILFRHMQTKPTIDWEGVAKNAGLKNSDTAKVRWNQIKRKLNIWDKATVREAPEPVTPVVTRRPGTRKPGPKPKVKMECGELEGLNIHELPQKPPRRKPGPKPKYRVPEVLSGYQNPEEDDDEDFYDLGKDDESEEVKDARSKEELRQAIRREREQAEKGAYRPVGGRTVESYAVNYAVARKPVVHDAQEFSFNTVRDKNENERANNEQVNNKRANSVRVNNDQANNVRANNVRANDERANSVRANNGRANSVRANSVRANNDQVNNVRANNVRVNNLRANNDQANNGRAMNGTQEFNYNAFRNNSVAHNLVKHDANANVFDFGTVQDNRVARNPVMQEPQTFNSNAMPAINYNAMPPITVPHDAKAAAGHSATDPVLLDGDHEVDSEDGLFIRQNPFFGYMKSENADHGGENGLGGREAELEQLQLLLEAQQPGPQQSQQPPPVSYITQTIEFDAEDLFGMED